MSRNQEQRSRGSTSHRPASSSSSSQRHQLPHAGHYEYHHHDDRHYDAMEADHNDHRPSSSSSSRRNVSRYQHDTTRAGGGGSGGSSTSGGGVIASRSTSRARSHSQDGSGGGKGYPSTSPPHLSGVACEEQMPTPPYYGGGGRGRGAERRSKSEGSVGYGARGVESGNSSRREEGFNHGYSPQADRHHHNHDDNQSGGGTSGDYYDHSSASHQHGYHYEGPVAAHKDEIPHHRSSRHDPRSSPPPQAQPPPPSHHHGRWHGRGGGESGGNGGSAVAGNSSHPYHYNGPSPWQNWQHGSNSGGGSGYSQQHDYRYKSTSQQESRSEDRRGQHEDHHGGDGGGMANAYYPVEGNTATAPIAVEDEQEGRPSSSGRSRDRTRVLHNSSSGRSRSEGAHQRPHQVGDGGHVAGQGNSVPSPRGETASSRDGGKHVTMHHQRHSAREGGHQPYPNTAVGYHSNQLPVPNRGSKGAPSSLESAATTPAVSAARAGVYWGGRSHMESPAAASQGDVAPNPPPQVIHHQHPDHLQNHQSRSQPPPSAPSVAASPQGVPISRQHPSNAAPGGAPPPSVAPLAVQPQSPTQTSAMLPPDMQRHLSSLPPKFRDRILTYEGQQREQKVGLEREFRTEHNDLCRQYGRLNELAGAINKYEMALEKLNLAEREGGQGSKDEMEKSKKPEELQTKKNVAPGSKNESVSTPTDPVAPLGTSPKEGEEDQHVQQGVDGAKASDDKNDKNTVPVPKTKDIGDDEMKAARTARRRKYLVDLAMKLQGRGGALDSIFSVMENSSPPDVPSASCDVSSSRYEELEQLRSSWTKERGGGHEKDVVGEEDDEEPIKLLNGGTPLDYLQHFLSFPAEKQGSILSEAKSLASRKTESYRVTVLDQNKADMQDRVRQSQETLGKLLREHERKINTKQSSYEAKLSGERDRLGSIADRSDEEVKEVLGRLEKRRGELMSLWEASVRSIQASSLPPPAPTPGAMCGFAKSPSEEVGTAVQTSDGERTKMDNANGLSNPAIPGKTSLVNLLHEQLAIVRGRRNSKDWRDKKRKRPLMTTSTADKERDVQRGDVKRKKSKIAEDGATHPKDSSGIGGESTVTIQTFPGTPVKTVGEESPVDRHGDAPTPRRSGQSIGSRQTSSSTVEATVSSMRLSDGSSINENDVMFGRGTLVNNHSGNRHFRALVRARQPLFGKVNRTRRPQLAMEIVNAIQSSNPPGRFLLQQKGGENAGVCGLWSVVSDEMAREKAMTALARKGDRTHRHRRADRRAPRSEAPPRLLCSVPPVDVLDGDVIGITLEDLEQVEKKFRRESRSTRNRRNMSEACDDIIGAFIGDANWLPEREKRSVMDMSCLSDFSFLD